MIDTIKSTEKTLREIRKQRLTAESRKDIPDSRRKELLDKLEEREKVAVINALRRYRTLLDAHDASKR